MTPGWKLDPTAVAPSGVTARAVPPTSAPRPSPKTVPSSLSALAPAHEQVGHGPDGQGIFERVAPVGVAGVQVPHDVATVVDGEGIPGAELSEVGDVVARRCRSLRFGRAGRCW